MKASGYVWPRITVFLLCNVVVHQFARCYSEGKPITGGLLRKAIHWPLPSAVGSLKPHEQAHEVTDLYLWLQ